MADYRVNVQARIDMIKRILRQAGGESREFSPIEFEQIRHFAAEAKAFTAKALELYGKILHKKQAKSLKAAMKDYDAIIGAKERKRLAVMLLDLEEHLGWFAEYAVAYLVRHPDKSDPAFIGRVSPTGRELSYSFENGQAKGGVAQAWRFAQFLIDECLLAARPIAIRVHPSKYERTMRFGRIIEAELSRAASVYAMSILITSAPEPHLDGDLCNTDGMTLKDWVKTPNAKKCADEVNLFFREQPQKNRGGTYEITLGLTHHPLILAFIVRTLRGDSQRALNFSVCQFMRRFHGDYTYDKQL